MGENGGQIRPFTPFWDELSSALCDNNFLMVSPCVRRAVGCLIFLFSYWNAMALTLDGGSQAKQGVFSSIAIVQGHPAVAWSNSLTSAIKYARALDPAGTVWGTPVVIDSQFPVGNKVCLLVVNGNPAVCYHHPALAERVLKYCRALDTTGAVWGTPVKLDAPWYAGLEASMEIVDGNPAIAYRNTSSLMYLRAKDANGSAWPAPAILSDVLANYPCLKVIEGRPAVAWTDIGGLWFLRGADSSGSSWLPPQKLAPLTDQQVHRSASMQIVNGRPAICYYDADLDRLRYLRAYDATGTSWPQPITVAEIEGGDDCSLAVVQGKPAIAFRDSGPMRALRYVEATDTEGATPATWKPPVTVEETGHLLHAITLFEVNGGPAIIHRNEELGTVHYLRATDGLWPPGIQVNQASGDAISPGGSVSFGVVRVGESAAVSFALKNPHAGSAPLSIDTWNIEGPDASSYSVVLQPADPIPSGGSAIFTVECRPVTPGPKNATLSLVSNSQSSSNPYRIVMTADANPHIDLEQPAGVPLTNNSALVFPSAFTGSHADLVFTLRNSGGAPLNIQSIIFDGPASPEFSVVALPPALPPGGTTTFTVRCAPVSPGNKSTVMSIQNDAGPAFSPFRIGLQMVPYGPDPAFNPPPDFAVSCLAVQPDGKFLAGGQASVDRFHANGAFDTAFFAPSLDGPVTSLAVQEDGMILLGGSFTEVDGKPHANLARIHANGAIDETFDPRPNFAVDRIVVCPDGKILITGLFGSVAGQDQPFLARLFPDGSLDTTLKSPMPLVGGSFRCVALQHDGKILVGGYFSSLSGIAANFIARLHPDGTLDNFPAMVGGNVENIAVQHDGKILVGAWGKLMRFNPDGSTDFSTPYDASGRIRELLPQADGKVVVSGSFQTFGGRSRLGLARVLPDGSVDDSFSVDAVRGAWNLGPQPDGKILLFATLRNPNGTSLSGLVKLSNTPAANRLYIAGNSTIRWLRGGSSPEVSSVRFEVKSADSLDWTPLGAGMPVEGGWELSGLSLPASGQIRAAGRAAGSLFETIIPILTPLESWRILHFHSSAGAGSAADDADPDQDGLTNFLEFAFGLSPVDRGSHSLPAFNRAGDTLTASFTAPAGMDDILLYAAEWSPSMLDGSWAAIPDAGTGGTHLFKLPVSGDRAFVRFAVKMR
jgi:uncharacterized delta-60 repeat protein